MAPGGGFRIVGIQPEVMHLIGDRQHLAGLQARQLPLQPQPVPCRALITDQQSLAGDHPAPAATATAFARAGVTACSDRFEIEIPQLQAQACGGGAPLAGDRLAVAEHQEMAQQPFRQQALEAQQGPQCFAGTGPGMHQHVFALRSGALQPPPHQIDHLALPLARLQPTAGDPAGIQAGCCCSGAWGSPAKIKGGCGHGALQWRHCAARRCGCRSGKMGICFQGFLRFHPYVQTIPPRTCSPCCSLRR